ncbi:MAG: ABC transporter permease [Bacteroidetes bacterium]|jgi:peptide/nickel transport system permease protein|nr:ABC transporter permease [Bacteroidota bacterium]
MMKNKLQKFTTLWLCFITLVALLAPFIANDKPYFFSADKTTVYTDYRQLQLDGKNNSGIFAIIPYSPGSADSYNSGPHSPFEKNFYYNSQNEKTVLPLRFHHWMGTDAIGADVAAGVVFGIRHSLFIAILSMLLAVIIAAALGIISGYYSLYGIRTSWSALISVLLFLWAIWFYGFYLFSDEWHLISSAGLFENYLVLKFLMLFTFLSILFIGLKKLLYSISFLRKEVNIFPDRWITTTTQLFISIPQLILIISLSVFFKPSAFKLAFIFGILMWTDLARIIRAEVLKMKQGGFVESCIASGLTTTQIVFRHILPNLKTVIKPLFLFGLASVVLTESGLSFLGLGVGPDTVTLGSLLAQAKENMDAWWLMLFPGLTLFITLLCLFQIGKASKKEN